MLIEIKRKKDIEKEREREKQANVCSNLLLFFSGRGDCCLAAKMGSQGSEWRMRSLTHLGWGLRVCVFVCVRERECLCSFVNEAAHKKSGTYSREVAEIHIL